MDKVVFFSADDGVHGDELWVTDGTTAGTRMVRDISTGSESSFASSIAALSDSLVIFRANWQLWVSDGTDAGTVPIFGASADSPSFVAWITPLGDGRAVFAADSPTTGRELWVTDGTADGTNLVSDIRAQSDPETGQPLSSGPYNFISLQNGQAVFKADDGIHGEEPWITDGTPAGTRLLGDIQAGPTGGLESFDSWMEPIPNGNVLLAADDGINGLEPWGTNGTPEGTRLLHDINPGEGDGFGDFIGVMPDGRHLFSPTEESGEYMGPWLTDGTPEGTFELRDQPGFSDPRPTVPVIDPWPYEQTGRFIKMDPWDLGDTINSPLNSGRLGDGRLLFTANVINITEIDGDTVTISGGSKQLAVTDGTVEGTSIFRPVDLAENGWGLDFNAGYFFALGDGRVAFRAYSEKTDSYSLWVADATGTITELAENVRIVTDLIPFPNNVWMFTNAVYLGELGADVELWVTDGTANGTRKLVEGLKGSGGVENLLVLEDGRTLLELEKSGETWQDVETELWLVEPSGQSIRFLSDEIALSDMTEPAQMGDGNVIFRRSTDDAGSEPWILNLTTGETRLLLDIKPGTASSFAGDFLSLTQPKQVDIDYDQISAVGETQEIGLEELFPAGFTEETTFSADSLPDGISLQSEGKALAGTLAAEPGIYTVSVTARDASGAEKVSTFDWTVFDTGKLKVSSSSGWQRDNDTYVSTPGSVITVGRKDGTGALFRVEPREAEIPVATIEDGRITLDGNVFSEQVVTDRPLMQGGFTIDMATAAVSDFSDADIATDHRLVADLIDLKFDTVAIGADRITFDTDLAFGDSAGDGPAFSALSTEGAPLSLGFGADGLEFGLAGGAERWSPEPVEFDLGGGSSISIGFSDLGIDYDADTDTTYLMGKATVGWGGEIENGFDFLDNDSAQSLVIDLAGEAQAGNHFQRGDRYLKITEGAAGWDWDVVGEITYEDKYEGPVPSNGLLVKELGIGFDTVQDAYSGNFKANIPLFFGLDLSAAVGFVSNPDLALDSIGFGVDGLDYPVGTTGLFVQGGSFGLENLAASDPDAGWTYNADISGTFGPDNDLVSSPLHGKIAGTVKETLQQGSIGYILNGSIALDSKVGYFLPEIVNDLASPLIDYFGADPADVTGFEILTASSATELDFTRDLVQLDAAISLLDGVVVGTAQLLDMPFGTDKDDRKITGSVAATLTIPEDFPLIGGMTRSGNARVEYSSDGDFSNDVAAFWGSISLPFGYVRQVGAELTFDGDYQFLGRKEIAKISSWPLDESIDLAILSARWEIAADDVAIELIAPDGTVLTEADIAARDDIALVADLNTQNARHVALQTPEAGIWDLRVAETGGLGVVRYEASEIRQGAVARIESLAHDPDAHQAEMVIDLEAGDAETVDVVIFAAPETGQVTGVELGTVTMSAGDPDVTHVIDYDALGAGDWHIYTRAEADGLAPGIEMYSAPVTIAGVADLETGVQQVQHTPTGQQIIRIEVTNKGDRPAQAGSLTIDAPAGMLGADPIPEHDAVPLGESRSELDLPPLAPGESFTVQVALPAGAEELADTIFVEAWAPGIDADRTDNALGQGLLSDANHLPAGQVTLTGPVALGSTVGVDLSGLVEPDGYDPATVEYQWVLDGTEIAGATGATHAVTAPEVGREISVEISYTDDDGADETVLSAAVRAAGIPQTLTGTPGPDSLVGGNGHDTIRGLESDDTLTGNAGDDRLEGGAGFDTGAYSGDQSSYTLTLSPAATTLTDRRAEGNGTDTLAGMEFLDFDT
ncbi:hypothetical protein DQW77_14430, partial [Roseovarius sp. TE539]|uniref:ELWxxDGT repeat protein n=1 Tax=Roseovarius sp. TE539 TaxID=2249812 RepID=UPI000DDEA176